jgi:3-deoxy-manno-octulosonate cytidylyltransferase (CMP-KDO synthetase)
MSFHVIIPARFASSRFPGKVLADIAGQSMLERVYLQACASGAEKVVIATDDVKVESAALALGAEVCMTDSKHLSGSDRIAEAALMLGLEDDAVIVNVQCDQPLIEPELIKKTATTLLENEGIKVATLATPITDLAALQDPDTVKVVLNYRKKAMYFSRSIIPHQRGAATSDSKAEIPHDSYLRHIGLYSYRMDMLQQFVSWDVCALEKIECLEQLRILWHGQRIHVDVVEKATTVSVDKPADIEKVIELLG